MTDRGVRGDERPAPTAPMRVFFDARWTRTDTHDGISRYGASLVRALNQLHPVTMLISDVRQLPLLPSEVPYVEINSPLSPKELLLSRTLHRLGADVVFTPLQVIGGFGRRYKLIVTLHDLIYYRHPQPPGFLPLPVRIVWRLYHRAYWPQRVLLNRADAVATVSETTKRLIEEHHLTRREVVVVSNAPPPDSASQPDHGSPSALNAPSDEVGAASDSPARDLLYMGSFMPYKDVETLIAGMAELHGYRLHLLSRISSARETQLRALIPAGADVVFWNGISDANYYGLLRHAAALVTASHDEGFGLPVIEAMNAGTPVVCSELDIFREVTGGHALFFAQGSASGFASQVKKLEDDGIRRETVESALVQAKNFTWERSAETLLGLMRSLKRR